MRPLVRAVVAGIGRGWVVRVVVTVGAIVLVLLSGTGVAAADGQPMVTIGESNDAAQRRELLELFGVPDGDAVVTVSVADTISAMDGVFDLGGIESAYSSTALRCAGPGAGLEVRTHQIEVVSPALYAMALVTAGIDDATLVVGAPEDAPAQGLTALAGVFRGWDAERCPNARTNDTRQRLALEQIAVAVRAGDALGDPPLATELVLRTQRSVVTRDLDGAAAIEAALAAEEAGMGVAIPEPARADLVGFLARLAAAKIDWGGYADGWTIESRADGSGLTMTGAGAAADRVEAEATGEAAAAAAATAAAGAAATSAAAAPPPPTATSPPAPTATAASVVVEGEVFAVDTGRIVVTHGDGEGPTLAYAVAASASIERNGDAVAAAALHRGDRVMLTIPAGAPGATTVLATAEAGGGAQLGGPWWLLVPIGVMVPATLLLGGRWGQPFVVRAVAVAVGEGEVASEAMAAATVVVGEASVRGDAERTEEDDKS